MPQTDIEKFFEIAVKVQRGPGELLTGTVDGVELTGDALIMAVVTKGKELGHEFTNEEIATWIERQREPGTGRALSDSDLDNIAGAFKERDKLWDDRR
jgi:hypothetical protein